MRLPDLTVLGWLSHEAFLPGQFERLCLKVLPVPDTISSEHGSSWWTG
ncbi:MAG TPA: hypothetical protein VH186_25340 [Chloroflexia bacterium]|nr:hypothetical protein [Chloroflexia bacterium]